MESICPVGEVSVVALSLQQGKRKWAVGLTQRGPQNGDNGRKRHQHYELGLDQERREERREMWDGDVGMDQGLSCKGPHSEYFRLHGPYSLCYNHGSLPQYLESIQTKYMNGEGCVPIKLYL